MDNLKGLPLLFVFVDTGFLGGMLKGVGAPLTPEGWGLALGSALLYLVSQVLQRKLNARGLRQMRRQLMEDLAAHLDARRQVAPANVVVPA